MRLYECPGDSEIFDCGIGVDTAKEPIVAIAVVLPYVGIESSDAVSCAVVVSIPLRVF